jgi:uncharacterized protein (TIGR00369 family)
VNSQITADEFLGVLRDGLPSAAAMPLDILALEHGVAVVRMRTGDGDLRPGGTLAGPVLFGLADLAMYAAVMTALGKMPLAVTTSATIHFLRRPKPGPLIARATLLKVGQRLVVGDVRIMSEGSDDPIAQATASYALPPR